MVVRWSHVLTQRIGGTEIVSGGVLKDTLKTGSVVGQSVGCESMPKPSRDPERKIEHIRVNLVNLVKSPAEEIGL